MKKRSYLLIIAVVFIAMTAGVGSARGAFKAQRFEVLGKTGDIIWIAEDMYEPAKRSRLHQVIVSDANVMAAVAELSNFSDWYPAKQLVDRLQEERFIELDKKRDYIGNKELLIEIRVPKKSAAMWEEFRGHIRAGGSGAESWNAAKGAEGMKLPAIKGRPMELIYYYPGGLYFNYEIDKAIWCADSGYLLIFTQQDIRVRGGDAMGGFFIFREVRERPFTNVTGTKVRKSKN